jgi:hypothetical protein
MPDRGRWCGLPLRARVTAPASAQSCAAQRLRNGVYVRFDLDGLSEPRQTESPLGYLTTDGVGAVSKWASRVQLGEPNRP